MNTRSSKLESVYWFGRHLYRMQFLSQRVPFHKNDQAIKFSRAFCLAAFDASSLNDLLYDHLQPFSFYKQFQTIKRDLVDIKDLLSDSTFQKLSDLTLQATENTQQISVLIDASKRILEQESHEILFFYRLGKHIEQVDIQLKLGLPISHSLKTIAPMMQLLHARGWESLCDAWHNFKKVSDINHFYHFNDQMQCAFEANQ